MAQTKFLDYSGLSYFYEKIDSKYIDTTEVQVPLKWDSVNNKLILDYTDKFTLFEGALDLDFSNIIANGGGLTTDNGKLKVNPANLVDGTTTVVENGKIKAVTQEYTLPTASSSVKGGVKIGDGVVMTGTNLDVLNAKVDNTTIEIDSTSKSLKVKDGVYATLINGQIDPSLLPSYVDDVIEAYYNPDDGKMYEEFTPGDPEAVPPTQDEYDGEITPDETKIYVDPRNPDTYRWSGSIYVNISGSAIDVITNAEIDAMMGIS